MKNFLISRFCNFQILHILPFDYKHKPRNAALQEMFCTLSYKFITTIRLSVDSFIGSSKQLPMEEV